MADLDRVVAEVAAALDRANIAYMVIGGLAVAVWGSARATGVKVKFCTAEDLILHKLVADRDRDRTDVAELIRLRGRQLDRDYLDALVHELAVAMDRPDLERRYRSLIGKA